MVVIRGSIGGSTSIRGQVSGSILFWGVFDLAAAATVVDIGRHQAEINFGHMAERPLGHTAL